MLAKGGGTKEGMPGAGGGGGDEGSASASGKTLGWSEAGEWEGGERCCECILDDRCGRGGGGGMVSVVFSSSSGRESWVCSCRYDSGDTYECMRNVDVLWKYVAIDPVFCRQRDIED